MGTSYLPAGVKVNCTFMTNGMPNELGVSRSVVTVFTNGNTPLLNIDDKKISASFKCKLQQSFWGGLAALCAAIAVAALIVFTGGTALVVIAAALAVGAVVGTAAGIATAGIVGLFQATHQCDCTLQASSQWVNNHRTVRLNKAYAILQQSYLHCAKGGIVQPFLNTHLALEAASKFTRQNNEQVDIHIVSEALQGAITAVSAGANPIGAVLCAGLTIGEYATENSPDRPNDASFKQDAVQAGKDAGRDTGLGLLPGTQDAANAVTKANENVVKELMEQGASLGEANALKDAFGFGWGKFGVEMGKGVGKGLLAAAVNFGIAQGDKAWTGHIADDVETERQEYVDNDSKDNIGIIANNP